MSVLPFSVVSVVALILLSIHELDKDVKENHVKILMEIQQLINKTAIVSFAMRCLNIKAVILTYNDSPILS